MMKTNNYTHIKATTAALLKKIGVSLAIAVTLGGLASCNVEEFPEEFEQAKKVDFHLNLEFETALPIYKEITVDSRNIVYSLRYIVNAYARTDGKCDYSKPTATLTVDNPDIEKLNRTIDINLPEGDYEFYVWTDYVDSQKPGDLYYNPSNFSEITLNEANGHSGSNEFRDAFRGGVQATVEENGSVTVPMIRPLGKYELISTDVEEFIDRAIERAEQRGDYSGTRDINTDDYLVTVKYSGYMPSALNIFNNRPIDSRLNVSYTSKLTKLPNDEMELGFDYVFVNGDETRVTVVVEVKEISSGEVISSTSGIDIPLKRSKLTIVRGKFLTSKISGGGIGIDPGFEGEWNYHVP